MHAMASSAHPHCMADLDNECHGLNIRTSSSLLAWVWGGSVPGSLGQCTLGLCPGLLGYCVRGLPCSVELWERHWRSVSCWRAWSEFLLWNRRALYWMKSLPAGLDPFQAWVRRFFCVACNRIWTKLLSKRAHSLVKTYIWSIFWHLLLPVVFFLRKSILKNNSVGDFS